MGILALAKRFSKTGRKLGRSEKSFQKAQQKAQIADIEGQLAHRATEDPREQSMLKQSMFGRGLGKSTIHTQGMKRLTDQQGRARAALQRNLDLAHRGLSLIKLRARAARRFMPYDIFEGIAGQDPSLSTFLPAGSDKDAGKGDVYEYTP